jgi:hypothetical protein
MKEIWKAINWERDIPKDKYLISNMGNVYNAWTDKPVKTYFYHNQVYFSMNWFDKENNRLRKAVPTVARTVATAFLPLPEGYNVMNQTDGLFVRHKDNDVTNNTVDNLEWCIRMKNKDIVKYVTIEAQVLMYELLLKYCNNRTWEELSDIVHNETGIRLEGYNIRGICTKKHDENSNIGRHFGLVGTSIQEVSDKRDKMLRPIVAAALSGTYEGSHPDETWVWVSYPDICKERYLISNYGRIMNMFGKIMKTRASSSGHLECFLDATTEKKTKHVVVARLTAYHFCDFPKGIEEHELKNIIIKYKDGDPTNLKIDNIYWTTHQGGTKFGIETDDIRDIINYVKTLVDKGYAVKDIQILANNKFHTNYSISKYQTMTRRATDIYNPTYQVLDVDCRKLRKRGTNTHVRLTEDEVVLVCEKLVEYNGNTMRAYEVIEELIPDIDISSIRAIRNGKSYQKISRQFFQPGEFKASINTPIEVYTLSGELLKRFDSMQDLANDKYFTPVDMRYQQLVRKFYGHDEIRVNDFIFRRVNVFRKSKKGTIRTTTRVDVINEVDESGNIVNVYYGYKDALKRLDFKSSTSIRYYITTHHKMQKNGHYLEYFGKKVVPLDELNDTE